MYDSNENNPNAQRLENLILREMVQNQQSSGSQLESGSQYGSGSQQDSRPLKGSTFMQRRRHQLENPKKNFQSELLEMYEDSIIIYGKDCEAQWLIDQKSPSDSLTRLHLSQCVLHWAQNLKLENLERIYRIFYEFIEGIKQGKYDLKKLIENFEKNDTVKFPSSLQYFRDGESYKMIKEYTKETFFYKLLALATRRSNLRVEFTSTVAFAIYQMHEELSQLSNQQLKQHKESNRQYKKTVYRGIKKFDEKQIEKLKAIKGEGEIFQFEGFLSTSQSQHVGARFADGNYLFVIDIDIDLDLKSLSGSQRIKGCFADIQGISSSPDQQEVLFSCFNYFEVKGYEEKPDPKLTVIQLKYIDVESVLNKPVGELSIAEKKVLESYKKTEYIIRSQVVNQGGIFFINFDLENFYNYHLEIAKKMVEKVIPVGEQCDQFINRHHNKLSKLAEQLAKNRPPEREFLRELVGYCLLQLSFNRTYSSSLLYAYFAKEQDPEILWMKFELLTEFMPSCHYWILLTLLIGAAIERIGFHSTHRDQVSQYLSKANKMSPALAFFAYSIQMIAKFKQRQESGIVCSAYRDTAPHHFVFISWFLRDQYIMNVWDKNSFCYNNRTMNLYCDFLNLLIDSCHFDKAQDLLEMLKKAIYSNFANEDLLQKQSDLLRKIEKKQKKLEAYFYFKRFIRSQHKVLTLADKARQIYLQLVKEQEAGSPLHAIYYNLACICLHAGPLEDAYGYISEILGSSPTQEMQLQVRVLTGRLWLNKQNSVDTQGVKQILESLKEILNNQTKLSGDCIADISDYLDELQKQFEGEKCVKQFARLAYRTVRWTPANEPPSRIDGRLLQFEYFKTLCQAVLQKMKTELQSKGQLSRFMQLSNVDTIEVLVPRLFQKVKAFLEDPDTFSGIKSWEQTIKSHFKDYPQIDTIFEKFFVIHPIIN